MIEIATNTPEAFYPRKDYRFHHLGRDISNTNAIVLMLEKNWGAGSISSINQTTQWINHYPEDIPCYLIGCEFTIPDKNLQRYIHKERDLAIQELCNTILKRSTSIGVRGEITHQYLIEILHFPNENIDTIFKIENNEAENEILLDYFLKKNSFAFKGFNPSILRFQKKPQVFYNAPIEQSDTISISKPYITLSENNARLNTNIIIDKKEITLWLETEIINKDYLLHEVSDAFICALLPYAMRAGKDIQSEGPISEQFSHNLNEFLVPQLSTHDARLYPTKIIGETTSIESIRGTSTGTGLSCGVDSLHTVKKYTQNIYPSMMITHLYCGNYAYGNSSLIYKRAEKAAKDLQLPLITTRTNINEVLKLPHLFTHFYKTIFGVLCLKKLFKIYHYSSAEDFSHFQLKDNSIRDTAEIELLLLYAFSDSNIQILPGGVKDERLAKTREIKDYHIAHKHLNVCLHPEGEINCGTCVKCVRTLLMIDMLGSLDLFTQVFDVNNYLNNRLSHLRYLITQKNSIMLKEVYDYFLNTEPATLIAAQEAIQK